MAGGNCKALILLIAFGFTSIKAMDCSYGQSKNSLEKWIHSCPLQVMGVAPLGSESYCCFTMGSGPDDVQVHCCEFSEFIFNIGSWPYWLAVLLVSAVLLVTCCICACCCRSSRRSPGVVYVQRGFGHQQF